MPKHQLHQCRRQVAKIKPSTIQRNRKFVSGKALHKSISFRHVVVISHILTILFVCIHRPEAMNLLIDLAYKNRKQNRDSDSTGSSVKSNSTSPRRLRRSNNKHNSSNTSNISHSENEKTDNSMSKYHIYRVQLCTVHCMVKVYHTYIHRTPFR